MVRTMAAGLALAALPALNFAGEPEILRKSRDGITVLHPPGAEAHARVACTNMPDILEDLARRLGLVAPERIRISLLRSREFEKIVGKRKGEWALAVAWPGSAAMIINLGRLDLRNDLYTTLKHETVHLVFGVLEAETGAPLPRWFHEGVAQWACEKLFSGTRDDFLVASRTGKLLPLSDLTSGFPDTGTAVNVAYAQSEDFIRYIENRFPGAVSAILSHSKRGLAFPEAFREGFGEDLAGAEAKWRDQLASGPPFLVLWLLSNPGALWILIFVFGAAVTFVGYLRVRRRRNELMKKWEHEEGEGYE